METMTYQAPKLDPAMVELFERRREFERELYRIAGVPLFETLAGRPRTASEANELLSRRSSNR